MRFLLDVNALIAFGFADHEFYSRFAVWANTLDRREFFTCSITELGFVRILAQTPKYGYTVEQARNLLLDLKSNQNVPLSLLADGNDISNLPQWAISHKQTTDGHLLELAKAHGAVLATFDVKIPEAFLIP